jgi:hypothetical protein
MTDSLPPSAVSIWKEGASLVIRFKESHTVRLPLNKYTKDGANIGWLVFLDVLSEREKAQGVIAMPQAPVQYDLEKAVRDFNKKPKAPAKPRPGNAAQRELASDIVGRLIGRKT